MRVRVGCEFQFESLHPVTTVMLVGHAADGAHRTIYESRWAEPVLPIRDFRDAFANSCWRIDFPEGSSTMRYDAVVDVDDEPDPSPSRRAARPARRTSPTRCSASRCPAATSSPIRSRTRLGAVRRHAADLGAGAGGLRLGAREHHVRSHGDRAARHGARAARAPRRRLPRLRPARDGVLSRAQHPGAIHLRLSPRHRRRRARHADGLPRVDARCSSPAAGTPSTRGTTCRASGASSSASDATPPTSR